MDLIELFRNDTDWHTTPAGQPVFKTGEAGELMYVLIEGQADVLVGNEVVESAGPGAVLGEMVLIDQGPRSATVMARTDCRLHPIDVKRFNALVQKTPGFAIHVMRVMADRIRSMNNRRALLVEHYLHF